jgi:FkbM family methyltransferase
MKVTRDGATFDVRSLAPASRFWEDHFATAWESGTKAVVDRCVNGGTFVDVGAWVGPVSLWAAHRGARVIAVEPDPVAYPDLVHNLSANCREFTSKRVAIGAHDGLTSLGRRDRWGDSMSSLTADHDRVEVSCLTLESFLSHFDLESLQLIKMDIEGGEGLVIPQCVAYLRRLGVPLCLSLHPQWWLRDPMPWLADWQAETVAHGEFLLRPPRRSFVSSTVGVADGAAGFPAKAASGSATISAVLIVKNEERTLGRCLESVHRAVNDVVVVDTGSTDATKAIAAEYGARTFDFTWCDDFAAARQFALEQATGDWVIWLDADDVVVGAEGLRALVSQASPDTAGFYCRYVLARDARGAATFTSWRERCVRNDGSFRWAGRVHEVLISTGPGTLARTDVVEVEHRPEPASGEGGRRNLHILEEELARSGDTPNPRLLFYLGREYVDVGDWPKAIETLTSYVLTGTWADERYIAQIQIAWLHRARGEYAEAIAAYWGALAILPRWPDAYFGLAATYYFLQDWDKVLHWTEVGRSLPTPTTLLFQNLRAYDYDWIIFYVHALWYHGRLAEALAWTRTALTFEPDNAWHLQNASVLGANAG